MKHLHYLCLLAPTAFIIGNAAPARADLYDDAKDIIQQLVEDDIATQAVPNAAAKIPAVCEFFPETVGALEDKRYSGLPVVLRGEVADAVGFIVMKQIYGDLGQLTTKSLVAVNVQQTAKKAAADSSRNASGVTDAVEREKPKVKTKSEFDAEHPLADWSKFSQRMAEQHAQMAVNSLVGAATASPPQTSPVSSTTTLTPQYCVFPSMQTSTAAAASTTPVAYESIATVALRACLAPQADLDSEAACAAGLLTRDAANGNNGALATDARRLAAALAVLGAKAGFSSGWQLTDQQYVTLAEDMAAWVAKPTDSDSFAKTVCASFPQAPSTCQHDVAAAAEPLLSSALPVNIATLDDALGLVAVVSTQCSSKVCTDINTIASGGEHIVSDIRSKNYGAAAGQVFDSVKAFTNCQKDDKRDFCSDRDQKVYTFLQKLAVFSIDSLTSNDGTSSAESDFRKAAVDMIEAIAGQGVHRNLFTNLGFLYVPELDLRYAWRPGHINRGTSSPMLLYPSIDLVRGRISNSFVVGSSSHFYYALTGSLLDPLGPLTEIATRDQRLDSDPARSHVFWESFLAPRGDIEFGIPELTKNLVVGGGTAVRLYRAQYNPGATTPTYCEIGAKCGRDSAQKLNWDNVELNVFVKYVP